jgi:ABC-type transport system involved in cytochrome c biogenesis permease subunit
MEAKLATFTLITYALALVEETIDPIHKRRSPSLFLYLALLVNAGYLAMRTIQAGHAPMANLYESIFTYAWCVGFAFLLLRNRARTFPLGIPVFITVLALLAFALSLPERSKLPRPLFPALQSPWFEVHVITNLVAYAGFTVSFGALFLHYVNRSRRVHWDRIAYWYISVGMFLFTLGIGTGAVWAYQAWGTYWSWDPKETWALITWSIYLIYLHVHIKGRTSLAAWVGIAGFCSMVFTYLGVNLVLAGLHSYK